jgi:hypothetical protein
MLSGRRAFQGDDVAESLAAVLRQDIDWSALPASTSVTVRHLIAGVSTATSDNGYAISAKRGSSGSPASLRDAAGPPPRSAWNRAMPIAAAVVAGALRGAAVW